jgi:hypothetical protein
VTTSLTDPIEIEKYRYVRGWIDVEELEYRVTTLLWQHDTDYMLALQDYQARMTPLIDANRRRAIRAREEAAWLRIKRFREAQTSDAA